MDFFGLDIGSRFVKAIQLKQRGSGFELVAYGACPSNGKGLLSDSESDLNALSEIVKKLTKESRMRTRNVAVAVPQDQVYTRMITVPKLVEEELTSALRWEAEQFVPIPLEEATLAHQVVGQINEDGKDKMRVLLVACPNRIVDKMIKVLQAADLNPVAIESEIFSVARSLAPVSSEPAMVVDLGARATDLAFVENGQVAFVYSIATAGEALTRAVATELGMEETQAEEYKKAYGVDSQQLEGKVSGAIDPILANIVKEMEKAIRFYVSGTSKTVKRVLLSGGTAALPEVANILAQKLNVEIQIGNPFSQVVKSDSGISVPDEQVFFYSVAVGLAMKEI